MGIAVSNLWTIPATWNHSTTLLGIPHQATLQDRIPMRYPNARLLVLFLLLPLIQACGKANISGTILGADGNPMAMAHVIVKNGPTDTTIVAPADASGRFAFRLTEPGGYGIYAMGVHHETLTIPFILTDDEELELHIRLAVNSAISEADTFQLVVADSEEGIEMQRHPDGSFAARVEASTDTLAYRIRHYESFSEWRSDRLVAGTNHDRIALNESGPFWDSEGDYFSIVEVGDEPFVDITFNSSVLPQHSEEARVSSTPSLVADIVDIYLDIEERQRRISEAMTDLGGGRVSLDFEVVDREAAAVREIIEQEEHSLLKQWLLLRYFDDLVRVRTDSTDKLLAQQALELVPPDSPFWTYEAWSRVGAGNLQIRLANAIDDIEKASAYTRQVVDNHPDPDVRAQFLRNGVYMADSQGDEETKWLYYSILQDEHAGTSQAEHVRRTLDPERMLQNGSPVPEFSFVSFDDSTVTITDTDLKGRTYLLDFWGTWCAPCIEEIPALEETYERYKESGFEILSIAFLDDPEDIQIFRKDRYPMPWLHTRVARKDDNSIRALFELTGFPRPILVDEEGMIIAIDAELRDGKVLDVVSAVYDGVD